MSPVAYTNPPLRTDFYLFLLYTISFICSAFGGVTATLMSSYLPVVLLDLKIDAESLEVVSAVINSVYLFGMLTGGLLLGFVSDRLGRKPALIISTLLIGLFTMLTSFAEGWQILAVFRFLSGAGVGGVLVSSTILIAEEWPERSRNIMLGILSITIPVGIFAAGFITYTIESWRTGFLVGILPLLLAGLTQVAILESHQWKKSEPQKNSETRTSIFNSDILYDLVIGCVIYGSMLIGLWAIFLWLPTWVQTMVQNSDGQKERGLSMILFAIGGLLGGFISGWVANRVGIKRSLIVCFAAVFAFSFMLFKLNHALNLFSYFNMAGIAVFFGMSQGILNVYIPELFPTAIRSSATGFCFNVGRIFTAAAVFFVGWLVNTLGGYGNTLFIFSFIFLIGLIATLFAREKNRLNQTDYGVH